MAVAELGFPVPSLPVVGTDFAPVHFENGTNLDHYARAFDGDAIEYAGPSTFMVPQDLDASGTINFDATGWSDTASASKTIVLRFDHLTLAASAAFDAAYTSVTSGALSVDATTGDLDILTWSVTRATLGWTAGEKVWFRIARIPTDANDNLNSVDWLWSHFNIRIPLA